MSFDFSTLVTDRTQADVNRVKQIAEKIKNGTASESELAEFNSAAMKGAYNYTDLNRVTAAMEALKAKLEGYGYAVPGYQRIKVPHPVTGGGSKLPEGYTELAWIESTGTQYIDTGFKPNNNTRVLASVANFLTTDKSTSVFGTRASSSSTDSFVLMVSSGGIYRSDYGSSKVSFASDVSFDGNIEIDKNKAVTSMNGVSVTGEKNTFSATYNLYLCGTNTGGSLSHGFKGKLYSCKIYDNGALVRNFVPCINPNGEVGLYDLVTAGFFGNSGTGSFVAGAIPRELPEGYTQVEYIQSSGAQYIDTGFVPNQDTRVVMDIDLTSAFSTYGWITLFATRNGSSVGFGLFSNAAMTSVYHVYASKNATISTSLKGRHTVDKNKNETFIDGNSIGSFAYTAFIAPLQLRLLYDNQPNGGDKHPFVGKVYSCQIYDNGTLVRDYVPCKNVSGVFGLYDLANDVFYQNAGTGTFVAGEEVVASATASVMVVSDDVTEYDPYTWYEFDWPTPETMTVYLLNVVALRSVFAVMKSTPSVPKDAVGLMVQEANNIEKILVDTNELLMKSTQVWFYSGDLFAGEVD